MTSIKTQSCRNPICWVITEGLAGTENQCIGVAEALGFPFKVKQIHLKQPWKTLSPYLGFERANIFDPILQPPWPDILITSGRKSIAAARFIKKHSAKPIFSVHIQDPRINPATFDLVAVPEHDHLRGGNVIVTRGAPNRITKDKLDKAKALFSNLSNLPSPKIAVLIGGKSKVYDLTEHDTKILAGQISTLNASLMITCSRRTGEENTQILKDALAGKKNNYFWDGSGENPYLAYLAYADFILVTADSASMISESCTTGKPVYMIDLQGGGKRIEQLHNTLISYGALRRFNGTLETFTYEPLYDAQMVANAIKKHFNSGN